MNFYAEIRDSDGLRDLFEEALTNDVSMQFGGRGDYRKILLQAKESDSA